MPAARKLEGQVFGRLTVIERFRSRKGRVTWLCRCSCGKLRELPSNDLTTGHTTSCGCLRRERLLASNTTHGHSARSGNTPTYRSWKSMRLRCLNSGSTGYECWGGRGISIDPRWDKFENFLADMGERPKGRTLDRIDVNGNYEPDNCRWATHMEQRMNQRPQRKRRSKQPEVTLAY
jgi:hypothetical protein